MNYDNTIQELTVKHFPRCPSWLWIKAQIWAESEFNPNAMSECGAKGLMQLMDATARELGVKDPFNPYDNIRGGVKFMRDLYARFKEIPDPIERYFFALASYNCGPGYVNKALSLARIANNLPGSYDAWSVQKKPGTWQTWAFTSLLLKSRECVVNGKRPDSKQVIDYVAKIARKVEEYQA